MEGAFFRTKKDILNSKLNFLDNKIRELDAALLFVSFILFTLFAFCINRGIPIKALYMDDLYMWSWYAESKDIVKFCTEGITERYRPVYWIFCYIESVLVGNKPIVYFYINIITNSLIALFIYYFAKKLYNNFFIAALSGVLYLVSHFSYYHIGQVMGILENLCMIFALLFLYFTVKYLNCDIKEKSNLYFAVILIIYVLASFTHERFIGLLPVFLVALLFKNRVRMSTRFIKTIIIILVLCAILVFRSFFTGNLIPSGTGGTQVTQTFQITEAIKYAFMQVLHIFGFTYGEDFLCGLRFNELDNIGKSFVYINLGMIILIEVLYLMIALSRGFKTSIEDIDKPSPRIGMDFVLLTFIAMNIIASSATIRLELRWVYVSMAGFILFAVFKVSEISRLADKKSVKIIMFMIFLIWFASRFFTDMAYRKGYKDIYCIKDQLKINSLIDETVSKHSEIDPTDMKIYIVDGKFIMSDFYASWLLRPFAKNKTDKVNQVKYVQSIDEVETLNKNTIVVKEKDDGTYEILNK